jgi:methylmalonyl-CoA epimerase
MFRRINHVGIVVKSIEEALVLYSERFGFQHSDIHEAPEEGMKTTMVLMGGINIELMEPLTPESSVGKFLVRRGEGLHHLSFEVDDIDGTLKLLAAGGIQPVDAKSRYFLDSKVNFLHPNFTGGVLIELIQKVAI